MRAHELTDMWFSLPGSGGIVRSLEWHRDTLGVGHESVVLQVVGYSGHSSKPSQEDVWWVCVERYPGIHSLVWITKSTELIGIPLDGDFATLSRNKDRVIRTSSEIRAEMEFPTGMAFAHVLRVLKIVHEVSPDYFVVGVRTMTTPRATLFSRHIVGKLLVLCVYSCRDARSCARAQPGSRWSLDQGRFPGIDRPSNDQGYQL